MEPLGTTVGGARPRRSGAAPLDGDAGGADPQGATQVVGSARRNIHGGNGPDLPGAADKATGAALALAAVFGKVRWPPGHDRTGRRGNRASSAAVRRRVATIA